MISSCVSPFKTTIFSLTRNPYARALETESITSSYASLKVISLNRKAFTLSRLILKRSSPASFRGFRKDFKRLPFVVSDRSLIDFTLLSALTISTISFLRRGSPPVSRILRIHMRPAICTNRRISSRVRHSKGGRGEVPSTGAQYTHRKLQRSVSDKIGRASCRERV